MDTCETAGPSDRPSRTAIRQMREQFIFTLSDGLNRLKKFRRSSLEADSTMFTRRGQLRVLSGALTGKETLAQLAALRREEVLRALIYDAEAKAAQEESKRLLGELAAQARAAAAHLWSQRMYWRTGDGMKLKFLAVEVLNMQTKIEQNPPRARTGVSYCGEIHQVIRILFSRLKEKRASPDFLPEIPDTTPFVGWFRRRPDDSPALLPQPSMWSGLDALLSQVMPNGDISHGTLYVPADVRAHQPATGSLSDLAQGLLECFYALVTARRELIVNAMGGDHNSDAAAVALQVESRFGLAQELTQVIDTTVARARKLYTYIEALQDLRTAYMQMRAVFQGAVDEYLDTGAPKYSTAQSAPDCFHGAAILLRTSEQLELVARALLALRGEEAMCEFYSDTNSELESWLPPAANQL